MAAVTRPVPHTASVRESCVTMELHTESIFADTRHNYMTLYIDIAR